MGDRKKIPTVVYGILRISKELTGTVPPQGKSSCKEHSVDYISQNRDGRSYANHSRQADSQ